VVSEVSDMKGRGGLGHKSRTSQIRVLSLGGSRLETGLGSTRLEMGLKGSRPKMFSGFEEGRL
jgi:hypothetical protein